MGRLIPRQTKVQTQFFKGLTLIDGVIVLVAMIFLALALLADFSIKIRLVLAATIIMLTVVMFLNIAPDTRMYQAIGSLFAFLFGVKKFTKQKHATRKSVNALLPYSGILEQNYDENTKVGIIDYKDYFGVAIEIKSIPLCTKNLLSSTATTASTYVLGSSLK